MKEMGLKYLRIYSMIRSLMILKWRDLEVGIYMYVLWFNIMIYIVFFFFGWVIILYFIFLLIILVVILIMLKIN